MLFDRAGLLKAIDTRVKWADAYDKQLVSNHQKAEREALSKAREALRAAARWSYAELKANVRYDDLRISVQMPACPQRFAPRLREYRKVVETSQQQQYTVSSNGKGMHWSELYHLLTFDPDAKSEVC